ncbi:MAG: hypothetical protein H0T53_03640 [Herpetosiphonaceae bacterium]|nr:hypothetical protein [Herpetosiphonaceae bacterium]
MMRYDHVGGKFLSAVRYLAAGTESLQDRVTQAINELSRLREAEMPPSLRSRFANLIRQTASLQSENQANAATPAPALTDAQASKIAEEIVALFRSIATTPRDSE